MDLPPIEISSQDIVRNTDEAYKTLVAGVDATLAGDMKGAQSKLSLLQERYMNDLYQRNKIFPATMSSYWRLVRVVCAYEMEKK